MFYIVLVLVPEGTYIYSRALHKWRRAATNPACRAVREYEYS
jgi:hypothetical protein